MKTSRRWVQSSLSVAGGLLLCLPGVLAAPGGGSAVGAVGSVSGGGGHAGASASVGGARSAAPSGGIRSSSATVSGFRSGPVGNAGATGYRAFGGNRPGFNSTLNTARSGNSLGQRPGTPQAVANGNYPSVARVNNAWTDPVASQAGATGGLSRYGGYATASRLGGSASSARPGQHLYSGAYGDGSNQFSSGHSQPGQKGGNGNRGNHRYYYNNFPYGIYYPYLYNNYGFGGYGDYGYGGGVADYSGLNADASLADLGAPNFSTTPNYYSYPAPEQETPGANPSAPAPAQPLPDAPPAVGPQTPSSANQPAAVAPGPDSLVEAVQNELAQRGYFAGKPDSMYGPATKEAIRRFQTDQGLPATGRINEATLHALHLD